MTKKNKKQIAEYIEAQLEFDPKELGGTALEDYEIRIYKSKPETKTNVAFTAIITKKGAFKNESLRSFPTKTVN